MGGRGYSGITQVLENRTKSNLASRSVGSFIRLFLNRRSDWSKREIEMKFFNSIFFCRGSSFVSDRINDVFNYTYIDVANAAIGQSDNLMIRYIHCGVYSQGQPESTLQRCCGIRG